MMLTPPGADPEHLKKAVGNILVVVVLGGVVVGNRRLMWCCR